MKRKMYFLHLIPSEIKKKKRVKVSLKNELFFLLQSPGLKMPSNIIAGHDMILSLLRFLEPNPGSHKRWTLCYRASSYGWAASTFHSHCDGKPHTVTIIRKGPYVFGGYTDIAWGENIGLF